MKNFLLSGALALFVGTSLYSQSKQQADPGATVTPSRNIYQKVSVQLPSGYGEAEVIQAVKDKAPLLKETGSELRTASLKESPGGFHYNFYQEWNGVTVYDASVLVNIMRSGRILNIMNNLQTFDPVVRGSFVFTLQDVKDHVSQKYGEGLHSFSVTVEKNYLITNNELLPVYKAITVDENTSYEIILDGSNLNQLKKRDLSAYHTSGGCVDTVGNGMVFNPDPLTTACVNYGGAYVDNGDQDITALNNERVSVILQDICLRNNQYWLEGPHVVIADLESPTIAPTNTSDGEFNYTRAQSGFEDVMCYYHIDFYQRYVQSLGFNNSANLPLNVDPHGLNGSDNSHFVPNGTNSRLAFGEGCVDDAEDADVIIHEYGHALSYFSSPSTNSGTERQGLDEGFGDYFAASYSKSISTCHWDDVFTWDGHNTCWPGRSATNPTSYPPSQTWDFYLYGEIWASTMMEVWDVEGRAVVDAVQLQELFSNQSNMTLNDAAHLVLDADSMLFNGSHTLAFQNAFCSRGIFTGAECVVSAQEPQTNTYNWEVYPNPASSQLNVSIEGLETSELSFVLLNSLGQQIQKGNLDVNNSRIDTQGLSEGIYFLNLLSEGQQISTKKVMIQN